MKIINKSIITAFIATTLFTSCMDKQGEEKITEVNHYSKIDSSISHLGENGYQRIDENWMKKRFNKFKELGIDTTMYGILDWPLNGIIEANLDEDSIKDFIVIVKSQFHPKIEIHYAIVTVMGNSFKSYEFPDHDFCFMETELLKLPKESKDFTEYELPHIRLEKSENVTSIYGYPNRVTDGNYNPFYFDTEKDKFEIIGYD